MAEYKVQFEVFEGPLDLLLYLVKKEEVDIYRVNLTKLATQFIEYVELMRRLDLDIAGEFLVMAATLMLIKSRELLPVDQQAQTEGDEDERDPRWELIRRLVEYKKFKDAAAQLQVLELRQEGSFPRQPIKVEFDRPPTRPEVSLFDLLGAVNVILRRFEERDGPRDIFADRWTVTEKIQVICQTLAQRAAVRFSELFSQATSRAEVVVTFLALLELIRLGQVAATQERAFGEIAIAALDSSLGLTPLAPAESPAAPAAAT